MCTQLMRRRTVRWASAPGADHATTMRTPPTGGPGLASAAMVGLSSTEVPIRRRRLRRGSCQGAVNRHHWRGCRYPKRMVLASSSPRINEGAEAVAPLVPSSR